MIPSTVTPGRRKKRRPAPRPFADMVGQNPPISTGDKVEFIMRRNALAITFPTDSMSVIDVIH